jgi:SAM-dependent methyltransferase
LQVGLTRRKLADLAQAHVARGDAADPDEACVDVVTCFFLLHEVPDAVKIRITRAMLDLVAPGGRAVFVDYHRPHRLHPLKPLMRRIFDWLEPFAASMWSREIRNLAGPIGDRFRWRKSTRFGGMYQIVVAERV